MAKSSTQATSSYAVAGNVCFVFTVGVVES